MDGSLPEKTGFCRLSMMVTSSRIFLGSPFWCQRSPARVSISGPNIAIKSRGWYHNGIKWLESLQNLLCFSILLKLIAGWINLSVVPLSKCEAVILWRHSFTQRVTYLNSTVTVSMCSFVLEKRLFLFSWSFSLGKASMPKSEWENQFCRRLAESLCCGTFCHGVKKYTCSSYLWVTVECWNDSDKCLCNPC